MTAEQAKRFEKLGREIAGKYDLDDFCGRSDFIVESLNLSPKGWNAAEVALMVAAGEEIVWIEGWRYGHIPADGLPSWNEFEGRHEDGISLQAIEGGQSTCRNTEILFEAEGAPIVRVRGILLDARGSDGEPLVCCAYEI